MRMSECENCRYCQKRWNRDRFGNYIDGYYGCHFLPYWGKPIASIGICPKKNADGTEKEWSLRNAVRVNK